MMQRDEVWTVIGGATLALLLWIGIAGLIYYEQAESDARIARDGRNLATAVAGQTDRALASADRELRLIAALVLRDGAGFDLKTLDAAAGLTNQQAVLIAVTDANGLLVQSTLPGTATDISLADREDFRIHAEHRATGLYVSAPIFGRAAKRWTLQLTRAITRPDGSFAGIVLASVDPAYLRDLYGGIDLGRGGMVALLGEDGQIRARTDAGDDVGTADLNGTALLDFARSGAPEPHAFDSPGDPVRRLYVAQRLSDYPLIALIGFDEREIARPLFRDRVADLTMGFTATALIGFFVFIICHRLRRQAAAETLLREAIEGMPDGFILFDPQDRLITWNRRYEAIFPYLKPILRPGIRFAELARYAAHFVTGSDDNAVREGWARWRIDRHLSQEPTFNQALADGRVLETAERPTSEGGIVSVTRDISALRRGEQTLAAAQARFREFALIATDWFWETDAQHRFTFVSERADRTRIYASALHRLDRMAEGSAAIQEALALQAPFRNQMLVLYRDNESMQLSLTGLPVRDAEGGFLGYRGCARSLTGQLAAEMALRADIVAAERHDHAALLNELGARIRAAAANGDAEAALSDLADNALELARLDRGEVRLERDWFEIGMVLERVIARLGPAADAKGVRFETQYATGAVPLFWGDAGRIRRLLDLLAGNALAHMRAGTITFVIGQERQGEADCMLCIEVRDQGSGIPSSAQIGLFEHGHGLGLKIFRRLVQLMAGEFGMTSELGSGSTFWFRLPLEAEKLMESPTAK
jgi:signal transduction histidine kinase